MLNNQSMRKKMEQYGINWTGELFAQLDRYADMLVDWNTRINLTAITQPEQIEDKHMLDCLLLAVQPELQGGKSVVDVGSGAGFPGMVLALYNSLLKVTLMEPTGKRVNFLADVAEKLGCEVDLVKERAEEAARKQWRESYDIAVARAVAGLPALAEYCLPLVKVGGTFIAMKGEAAAQELAEAQNAIQRLGGEPVDIRDFTLPDGSRRSLVIIQKHAETPAQYPRNGGTIAKKPL